MPSGPETAGDARCRGSWDSSAGAAEARSEHRPSLAARNEQSGNGLAITRCWRSGKPERSAPAPEPDRPVRRHRANRPQLSWLRPKRSQVYAYSHHLEEAEAAYVHVAGRTKVWSRRRSQHRDHGVRSENCGAVNSIKQTQLEPAVLEHSKGGIKPFAAMRC